MATADYYQVMPDWGGSGGWRLYRGNGLAVTPVRAGKQQVYKSVADAKVACYKRFGEVPVRVYDDEAAFTPDSMVHAALAEIEARHTDAAVVAVGSAHYLIRRSKFGVEVRVRYTKTETGVAARNDFEHFAPKKLEPTC